MEYRCKIVADQDIPYLKGVLEPYCDVRYKDGASIGPNDVADADALMIRTRTKCDASLLDGSRVKLITTATIGHDHIDMEYCSRNGIEVSTSAGCNVRAVLQYVMAALTVLSGENAWKPGYKTIGIVGVGNVGSAVKRFAEAVGFKVLCCDPPRMEREPELGFMSIFDMLAECDIVTMHVPLTFSGPYSTESMAGRKFFDAFEEGTIFINTSRGEIIDEEALCRHIESGYITAVIDTWRNEPDINRKLLKLSRFSTPHIAGYSQEGKAAGTAMAVESIACKFSLPIRGWYPADAPHSLENLSISWRETAERMKFYFDIEKESAALKENPDSFERLRNLYEFRREFF